MHTHYLLLFRRIWGNAECYRQKGMNLKSLYYHKCNKKFAKTSWLGYRFPKRFMKDERSTMLFLWPGGNCIDEYTAAQYVPRDFYQVT